MRPGEHNDPFLTWFARNPGPWFALVWLPVLLAAPLAAAISTSNVLDGGLLIAIALLFVAAVTLPYTHQPRWMAEGAVAVLTLTVAGYLTRTGDDGNVVYPLLAIGMATGLRPRLAPSVIAAVSITAAIGTAVTSRAFGDALLLGFTTFMAGASTFLITVLTQTLAALTASRKQLAASAVAHERERLARDLHDLLGHTLSVIVVKAEAVRRMLSSDVSAAIDHARDIERIGRSTLAEVRQAVADERAVTLRAELLNAHVALDAAGIRLQSTVSAESCTDLDPVLAWVIREAVTNVIRHSEATSCTITLARDEAEVTVEVIDNGRRARSWTPGQGLTGLRERVRRTGGVLITESGAQGFRLSATVPTAMPGTDVRS